MSWNYEGAFRHYSTGGKLGRGYRLVLVFGNGTEATLIEPSLLKSKRFDQSRLPPLSKVGVSPQRALRALIDQAYSFDTRRRRYNRAMVQRAACAIRRAMEAGHG